MFDTNLEVVSNGQANRYRVNPLVNAGNMTRTGLEIRLTEAFTLRARNGDKNLTLEVTILDRASKQQVFQDIAGRYQSIAVAN